MISTDFVTVAPWKLFTFVGGTAAVWPSSWNAQFMAAPEGVNERERGRESVSDLCMCVRLAQTP